MKLLRFFLGAVAAAAVCAGAARAADGAKPSVKVDDLFPDKVLAKGKGVEVKQSEVEAEYLAFKMEASINGSEVPESKRAETEKKILDRLVVTRLLINKSTADDKAKAKEAVDKFVSRAREQTGTEEAFKRQIEARGLSVEEFTNKLMERGIAEQVFKREVKDKIVVTDEDIKKFYDENPDRFKQPELVKAIHILKLTFDPKLRGVANANAELSEDAKKLKRQEIEGLLKRARDGEDFEKLANDNSEDPAVRQNKGYYTFARGQMAPEFETAAFSLGINQMSDVVVTKSGFHIIKVVEKTPAQTVELEKVKEKIKDFLVTQAADKQVPEFTEKAKQEAGVEYTP